VGRNGELSLILSADKLMNSNLNISFTGEYRYAIDQKNRVNIPAKYRKALKPVNDRTFVLTQGFDNCLLLYPLDEWQVVEQQLSLLSSMKQKHRTFVRSIVRFATHVQFDSQGRIQIPETLSKFASITKDVVFIGMIKKIEIWDPLELEKFETAKLNIDSEDFEDLANDINF